jgi:hypothetical protein
MTHVSKDADHTSVTNTDLIVTVMLLQSLRNSTQDILNLSLVCGPGRNTPFSTVEGQ